jgi:hypothetical protein
MLQVSSLCQVVELLKSKGVEPTVRRSALTQVSVMLEDRTLHDQFLEQDGVNLILDILHKALVSCLPTWKVIAYIHSCQRDKNMIQTVSIKYLELPKNIYILLLKSVATDICSMALTFLNDNVLLH